METDETKEHRQALESKRNALFTRLKKLDSHATYKTYEARALQTVLKGKMRPDTRTLRRRLNLLEFKVETEATTLQIERQLMKEIRKTEKELAEAFEVERQFRKLAYLESDIQEYEKEMTQLEGDLQETNRELAEMDKQAREEHKKRVFEERAKHAGEAREKWRKETGEKAKKDTEPYMAKLEPTVTLEDICVIRKKEERKDEEE